jgi:hypothetical protein
MKAKITILILFALFGCNSTKEVEQQKIGDYNTYLFIDGIQVVRIDSILIYGKKRIIGFTEDGAEVHEFEYFRKMTVGGGMIVNYTTMLNGDISTDTLRTKKLK